MSRPRKPAEQTTSTIYQGADGQWHARVTMERRPDGTTARKHVQRRTKTELRDAVRDLERRRDAVRYDPGVRADHDVRGTVRTWLGRKFFYGTGGADLAARHGDKDAPAVLSPTMALSGWALLQRRWWSLPVAVVAGAVTARRLAPQLPIEDGRHAVAVRLTAKGTGWAVRQEAGLLLRHWWPLAALAAPFSRQVRRALLSAVAVDMFVFLRERTGVDPLTALAARRLDDLAYGSGLWWGAIRHRSPRCLLPRSSGRKGS